MADSNWSLQRLQKNLCDCKWSGVEIPKNAETRGGAIVTMTVDTIDSDLKNAWVLWEYHPAMTRTVNGKLGHEPTRLEVSLSRDEKGNPVISWSRKNPIRTREFVYRDGKLYGLLTNRMYQTWVVMERLR